MIDDKTCKPLRILHVEDNPLIVFHVEQIIEDLGHIFVGSVESFIDLKEKLDEVNVEGVLLDMDLADGSTGPAAAAWLKDRGVPTIFVTGQDGLAAQYSNLALAVISKPVSLEALRDKVQLFRSRSAPI